MRERYGPWALIVGGSEGIGASFAWALAERGLDIVLVGRRASLVDDLAARLRSEHGVATRAVAADVSTPAGLAEITGLTEDIGLLVCNAAFAPVAPFLDLTAEQLDTMLDLNCRCAARLSHAIGARLVARGRGGVILLSSLAGDQGTALVAHYAATKAYLRVLAEGLWDEWRPYGVDALACCPGLVQTPTLERSAPEPPGAFVPGLLRPDDVARAALAELGRRPVVIPGWRYRLASAATRLLPRGTAVTLASKQTRKMYPTGSGRPAPADGENE